MITHYIYHLPGLKVGCTKNLKQRLRHYPRHQIVLMQVLEELHDCTDQAAGDREQWWNKHFGYKGQHQPYAQTINTMTPEQRSENGRSAFELGVGVHGLTPEQRRENSRISGRRAVELGVGIHGMTRERRSEIGRKSARKMAELGLGLHALTAADQLVNRRKAGRIVVERGLGIHGLTPERKAEIARKGGLISGPMLNRMRGVCPHCGWEGRLGHLHRHHRGNCKKKVLIVRPTRTTIRWLITRPAYVSRPSTMGV